MPFAGPDFDSREAASDAAKVEAERFIDSECEGIHADGLFDSKDGRIDMSIQ